MNYIAKVLAVFILAVAVLNLFLSNPVHSQQQAACGDRTKVLKHLSGKYKEAPRSLGLANNGGVMELLVSPKGNSWTIIITMPNGPTCMVAAGENWENIPVKETKKGNGI